MTGKIKKRQHFGAWAIFAMGRVYGTFVCDDFESFDADIFGHILLLSTWNDTHHFLHAGHEQDRLEQ